MNYFEQKQRFSSRNVNFWLPVISFLSEKVIIISLAVTVSRNQEIFWHCLNYIVAPNWRWNFIELCDTILSMVSVFRCLGHSVIFINIISITNINNHLAHPCVDCSSDKEVFKRCTLRLCLEETWELDWMLACVKCISSRGCCWLNTSCLLSRSWLSIWAGGSSSQWAGP